MLSRVAERTYWLARYLERAENLARICNVFGKLFLDLPRSAGIGWPEICKIIDLEINAPAVTGQDADSHAIEMLLFRSDNPMSLVSSVGLARENARTTRDILPREAWLTINKLHLITQSTAVAPAPGGSLHEYLSGVVAACHQLNGLLVGTMSHSVAHNFMVIGRHLERADMTTRTLDAAARMLMTGRGDLNPLITSLWATVLRSVSGYQMYRQYVRRRIVAADVIGFLCENREFPRSVTYCITQLIESISQLPRNEQVREAFLPLHNRLGSVDTAALSSAGLHDVIDRLQLDIASVHEAISNNWFYVWKSK